MILQVILIKNTFMNHEKKESKRSLVPFVFTVTNEIVIFLVFIWFGSLSFEMSNLNLNDKNIVLSY